MPGPSGASRCYRHSVRLILYSKPGCHLCEAVREDAAHLPGIEIEERDITTNPDWEARFRYLIPVVERSDGAMLEPPISADALRHFVQGGA